MPTATDLEIPARDGRPLAATLHAPDGDGVPPGTVVILSATAVKRSYYAPFAAFLAARGLRAVTFDYRGIGGSRPPKLRGFRARMSDWAELDADAVLAWAGERFAGGLVAVGHSYGGQCLGLLEESPRLDAALLVAAQSGYWRHWPGVRRWGLLALWILGIPVLSRLCGYFPARRLGMGEDLPAGVAREWAHWGRHPDYLLRAGEGRRAAYAGLRLPILALSIADDAFAPRPAVESLLAFYTGATIEHRHLRPADLGLRAIGHFGFFREKLRDALWNEPVAWLEARLGSRPPT